ncbi:MAG: hypothetical protein EZS28_016154 [Streblomastix strix]|uniref:Uncharacterized protein n=1 Tax=Streblomastix strix TaxID=222440 RepID=A0A5J4W0F7_9EUKA|nr:MAG: hypothetical protein EZS28_016154 [Streblomastix strix]
MDPTADADCQHGAKGGNFKDNTGAEDKAVEPSIPHAQTEWRMEKNLRLTNIEYRAYSQTLQDDRHPRYDLDVENSGLDVHVLCNVCLQSLNDQLTIATISGVPDTGNQLHISGDAIWDQYCAIFICESSTTYSGESERERQNANIELCGRYYSVQQ